MMDVERLAGSIQAIWTHDGPSLENGDREVLSEAMALIDRGVARAAVKSKDDWSVVRWVKMALDLYYRHSGPMTTSDADPLPFRDRFPLKADLEDTDARFGVPAAARYGAYVGPGTVLVAAYAHLGVWVGEDSLIDSWVSLGTCAQIGARVKILPCTSVVGSLYPIDSPPTVIEDDCFVGSGSVVGSGVTIRKGAVVAPGVNISANSPVVDFTSERPVSLGGDVPEGSVIVPGTVPVGRSGSAISVAALVGYRDWDLTARENLEQGARRLVSL